MPLATVCGMLQSANDLLPILRDLLRRGLLVPVLGAGMSRGTGGKDWAAFVKALEKEAKLGSAQDGKDDEDYAMRAELALRLLRSDTEKSIEIIDIIKNSTGTATLKSSSTKQLLALAQHRWPLVITMNYDGWYEKSFQKKWGSTYPDIVTKGRTPEDCWSVIRSLTTIKSPLCWAIHGRFESPEELVITSSDYRNALHDEQHFRRAIAMVIRQRSLLFLGTSMDDPHLNDVLDEDAHHLGGTSLPRFAIFIGKNITVSQAIYLRTERGIIPIHMSADDLPEWLNQLCCTEVSRGGLNGMTYEQTFSQQGNSVEVTLSNRKVTLADIEDTNSSSHIWGLSAGIGGTGWHVAEWVSKMGIHPPAAVVPPSGICESQKHPNVWFVQSQKRAADKTWRRDLRAIGENLTHLLDVAVKRNAPVLHLNLIGGGEGRDDPSPWYLIAMLQAIRLHSLAAPDSQLRIDIHLTDRDVLFELLGGRLSPSTILAGPPWPVWIDASPLRELRQRTTLTGPGATVHDLIAQAGFPPDKIRIDIEPRPSTAKESITPQSTVASAGILPGATLKLRHV